MTMAQFTAVTDRPTIIRIMASKRHRELISTIVIWVIYVAWLAYVIATKQLHHGFPLRPLSVLMLVALTGSAYSYANSRCPACDTPIG